MPGQFVTDVLGPNPAEVLNWQVSDGALTTVGTLTLTVEEQPLRVEQPLGEPRIHAGAVVDFLTVSPGAGGLTKTFHLKNQGDETLTLGSVTPTGGEAADFIVDATGMAASLVPEQATTFTVRFDPAALGVKNTLLEIANGDPGTPVFQIPLTGEAVTPAGGLDALATDSGPSGPQAEAGATPFEDGVANLLKYAFNMDLSGPDTHTMVPGGDSGLPLFTVGEDGGQKFWRMEFVRGKASGLEYTLEQSTTLLEGSFAPVDLGPAQADDIDDFWERVSLEVIYDEVTEPKGFLRARVRVP